MNICRAGSAGSPPDPDEQAWEEWTKANQYHACLSGAKDIFLAGIKAERERNK